MSSTAISFLIIAICSIYQYMSSGVVTSSLATMSLAICNLVPMISAERRRKADAEEDKVYEKAAMIGLLPIAVLCLCSIFDFNMHKLTLSIVSITPIITYAAVCIPTYNKANSEIKVLDENEKSSEWRIERLSSIYTKAGIYKDRQFVFTLLSTIIICIISLFDIQYTRFCLFNGIIVCAVNAAIEVFIVISKNRDAKRIMRVENRNEQSIR